MKSPVFSLLFLLANSVFSQGMVEGRITSITGEPIPFASVAIENTYKGTITNSEGRFEIKIEKGNVLLISCIGFESQRISKFNRSIQVVLKESSIVLDEVRVSGNSARSMVEKAINGLKSNYDFEPLTYRFYGATERFYFSEPGYVQEAVFDIYSKGWKYDILKLRGKYKEEYKEEFDKSRTIWLGFIEYQFLEKNPGSWYLKKNQLDLFEYEFDSLVSLNGRPTEVIVAIPTERGKRKGKKQHTLFIDSENFGVAKAIESHGRHSEIAYKFDGNKWYLSSYFTHVKKLDHRDDLTFKNFFIVTEMIPGKNNAIEALGYKVVQESKFRMGDWNDAFWEDYNHMVLDEIWN